MNSYLLDQELKTGMDRRYIQGIRKKVQKVYWEGVYKVKFMYNLFKILYEVKIKLCESCMNDSLQ